MNSDNMDAIDEDVDENNLLDDFLYDENGQDLELTRLTEMVRKQYLKYLEKQLHENLVNSCLSNNGNGIQNELHDGLYNVSIKKTAELLEDKAVKACMVAKFYQRAMVKIIAIVRRSTQERKLIHQLSKCIHSKEETSSKATQTEAKIFETIYTTGKISEIPKYNEVNTEFTMSLDEKIEIFQKHLQKEKSLEATKKCSLLRANDEIKKCKKYYNYRNSSSRHRHYRHTNETKLKSNEEIGFSPTPSTSQPKTLISPAEKYQTPVNTIRAVHSETNNLEEENTNDSVALELARIFSEEKTELDEIFGIDPNDEPDDPQICKILKEIEEAQINHVNTENLPLLASSKTTTENNFENSITNLERNNLDNKFIDTSVVDLSKSIWPCELFMQRRTLSESLARLLEEDLRWHDIMKWKFFQLFGEDSDDEFTPCSPSIELDEVLIGSCVRRISPWIVKHLMKPMRDGLIGNRFLFKKLAKQLAQSIIMENQYPDELVIKNYVENFFCLYQAVMSLEDLDVNMPSISSL